MSTLRICTSRRHSNLKYLSDWTWLIYNAPMEYAELVLNGDVEKYLKDVTEYKLLD